jgi:ABC-type sugar transport system permease subunit
MPVKTLKAPGGAARLEPHRREPERVRRRKSRKGGTSFLLPAMIVIAVFYLVPNLLNLGLAFTNWSTYSDTISFTGLDNFRGLLDRGVLTNGLRVTVTYAVVVMIAQNVAGVVLALALERRTRANGLFRAVFFLPVLVSSLAAGYVFKAILADDGPLNGVLSAVTGTDVHVAWLGSTTWTIVVVALVNAWKFMGINMLVYIAGLNAIPGELIDSARVDGASWFRVLRHVKLPLLAPAITFNFVATLIGAFNTFDIVFAMTQGGPGRSTEVLNTLVQQQYAAGYFGDSIAMGLLLVLLTSVIAFPVLFSLRRRELDL